MVSSSSDDVEVVVSSRELVLEFVPEEEEIVDVEEKLDDVFVGRLVLDGVFSCSNVEDRSRDDESPVEDRNELTLALELKLKLELPELRESSEVREVREVRTLCELNCDVDGVNVLLVLLSELTPASVSPFVVCCCPRSGFTKRANNSS